MEYLYYKSKKGNFGDDLNGWLWPKLFGTNGSGAGNGFYFVGIGSLLHNDSHVVKGLDIDRKKVVFGTGVKPSKVYAKLKLDESWDVMFLRGPLSSGELNRKDDYITDAAYAIRQLVDFEEIRQQPKKYKVSLMPYFHSTDFFDWKKICDQLGYHYISPHSEEGVEFTLKEIAASECLITEAMHGAIMADTLRVPWHRFILSTPYTEGGRISDFKWTDWLMSIDIPFPQSTYIPFYQKGPINKLTKMITNNFLSLEYLPKGKVGKDVVKKLKDIDLFYLSEDVKISEIDAKIHQKIADFKLSYL
ncbi:hypothetical protein [Echinicola sp. 20G]|uniref:hypothetical protein n=1 Tax=Echinicola sp. 20G TaxID=2781961 RepID=UPI001911064A|nr:hypothetical protein [Echinicola sp. 20G]